MIARLTKGESPSLMDTDKANELIDTINALTNSKGAKGIQVKADQSGALTIFPSESNLIQATFHPFEIIGINENGISINAGTINNELVVPVGGVDHSPTESLKYLVAEVNASANGINSAEYKVLGSPPDSYEFKENAIPPKLEILIAVIKELEWEQVISTNLQANIVKAYESPKESVNVGEYDSNIFWRWSVTSA